MRLLICSIAAAASGLLGAGLAGQASATGTIQGCPPSYTVWRVGSQTPPYHVDAAVNKNGDNFVCAKQIDNKTFEYQGQSYALYNFIDNTSVKA